MSTENPKIPNSNAVKELRERYLKRKEDRRKKHGELAKVWKKKSPTKKIAKDSDLTDIEL